MNLNQINGKAPVIMQVLPNLEQGGVERGTVDASKAIIKAGGVSIVVANGGKLADEIQQNKGIFIQMPVHTKKPLKILKNARRLRALIKEYDVDIVHARSRAPAYSCYFACKKSKAKFVTTFHAAYPFHNKLKKKYNSIMAKGDQVIAISKFVRNYIADGYGLDKSNINLVIRGTDMEKFNPSVVDNEKMSKIINDWNIPEGNPIVFCPGRLSKIKGQETLVDAAKILKNKGFNDVSYVLSGSDQGRVEYSSMLVNKIKDLGLTENFYLVNNTKDMPTACAISDVVLSLSVHPEGFGRIPTEAGAMGRPVIATKIGGHLETIIDGETGSLIGLNDARGLAKNIEKYLEMPAKEKEALSKKAIKNVRDNFSTEIMFKQLFGVYNSLLK